MIYFFLGMLTLYLIEGIILIIDNCTQSKIWLDDWLMWVFCWWIIAIYCIIGLPIKFIKNKTKKK